MTKDNHFMNGKNLTGGSCFGSQRSAAKPGSLKITAIGDGMVGKTCMLITYTTQKFPNEYVATVFDNYPDTLTVDGEEYDIVLWDTAGQEDYERLRPLSYSGTNCFVFCFSIGARSSFENILSKWYPEIKHWCPNVPIILVGTKSDLRDTGVDTISVKEAKKMRKKLKVANYMECSALKNEGLAEIFVEAVRAATKPQKNSRFCRIL